MKYPGRPNNPMATLIAVTVFLAALFLALGLFLLNQERIQRRRRQVRKRLQSAAGQARAPTLKAAPAPGWPVRWIGRLVDLAPFESLAAGAGTRLRLEQLFNLSLGAGLLFMLPPLAVLRNPLAALPCMAVGLALPWLYLFWRRKQREQALVQQLPDALEMIVRAVRAGQSVDGALREIAASSAPPLGEAFRLVYEEMAMGLSFDKALRNFQQRFNGVPDIRIICTAFIVQRETGGNLTKILGGLADTVRQRFQLQRQIRALTAEGRTSALILGMLPILLALFFWIFNPGYIHLLINHPEGRKLLLVAVVLVGTGFTVMRMMTRMDA
ncbi:MAG: type II secretion system F family protein [Desulfatitalea sp.]|nr:type II secretion system F family protein [Desulfatitalea sp.]